MKLSQIKTILKTVQKVIFEFENSSIISENLYVTKIEIEIKDVIDIVGGLLKKEPIINFILAKSVNCHDNSQPSILLRAIELAEKTGEIADFKIEMTYTAATTEKFDLDFNGGNFQLKNKQNPILIYDNCAFPLIKKKIKLSQL
jgi:hypothetical protein